MVKQKKTKVNIHAEGKLTKKFRENPWMVSTLVLGIFLLGFMVAEFVPDESINVVESNDSLCSQIRVTPTWVDVTGQMREGYTTFNDEDPSIIVDRLIEGEVKFVYHPDCSYCKMQIEYFNESWGKYVDSGLTVNCK